MEQKLIAIAVTENDKTQFKKILSKLHTQGKIHTTIESKFIRDAINEKLESLGVRRFKL